MPLTLKIGDFTILVIMLIRPGDVICHMRAWRNCTLLCIAATSHRQVDGDFILIFNLCAFDFEGLTCIWEREIFQLCL